MTTTIVYLFSFMNKKIWFWNFLTFKDITEYIANGDDNDFILQCVQRCVIANIEQYLEYVEKKQENLSFIGTGRLLQALPDLCPALRTCTLAPKLLKIDEFDNDYMFR